MVVGCCAVSRFVGGLCRLLGLVLLSVRCVCALCLFVGWPVVVGRLLSVCFGCWLWVGLVGLAVVWWFFVVGLVFVCLLFGVFGCRWFVCLVSVGCFGFVLLVLVGGLCAVWCCFLVLLGLTLLARVTRSIANLPPLRWLLSSIISLGSPAFYTFTYFYPL